jgi:hypothetical protein
LLQGVSAVRRSGGLAIRWLRAVRRRIVRLFRDAGECAEKPS